MRITLELNGTSMDFEQTDSFFDPMDEELYDSEDQMTWLCAMDKFLDMLVMAGYTIDKDRVFDAISNSRSKLFKELTNQKISTYYDDDDDDDDYDEDYEDDDDDLDDGQSLSPFSKENSNKELD